MHPSLPDASSLGIFTSFHTYGQAALGGLLLSPQGEGFAVLNPPTPTPPPHTHTHTLCSWAPGRVAAEVSGPETPCPDWMRLEPGE